MAGVTIKEARENLKAIIDRMCAGERIDILRRTKIVAQLIPPQPTRSRCAPSMKTSRNSIAIKGKPMSREVIEGRQEERY